MTQTDVEAVADLTQAREKLLAEIGKVIIGQREIVDQLIISLLAGGHCLLVGVRVWPRPSSSAPSPSAWI